MPQIESYDEFKDPLDHLETFKTLIHLQGVPDKIMCRAFPTTLKGAVRIWFSRLTPNSINTFKELSTQFTSHFIGRHRYKKRTDTHPREQAPRWENDHPRPPVEDIRMIIGGTVTTGSSKKA